VDLLRLLPGCVGYLAGVEDINAEALAAATSLKVISRNGVGVNNVDLVAAERRGVVVCKALGSNARGVAELTIALLLSLARWVPLSDSGIKAGGWERRKGIELAGKVLGLVGCGSIGRMVARFALGMDMQVRAYDVVQDLMFSPGPGFRYGSLDEVLSSAHVISLHSPAPADGRALIDAAALAKVQKGVFIINTARAELLDEAAVVRAIEDGTVAGLAMDVFRSEPPPKSSPLIASDRVIATPHIGGFTDESVDRAVDIAVDNLLAALGQQGEGA
jgi:phosphoglycerate dehydrogenase-like enzyme